MAHSLRDVSHKEEAVKDVIKGQKCIRWGRFFVLLNKWSIYAMYEVSPERNKHLFTVDITKMYGSAEIKVRIYMK